MSRISEKIARFIERHPMWFIIIAAAITAAAVPGLTLLETETGFSALVSEDADISINNIRYQEQFGGESINVMFTGQLDELFSTQNLVLLSQLEQKLYEDDTYIAIHSPLQILNLAITEAAQTIETLNQQITNAQEQAAEEAIAAASAAGLDEEQQKVAAEQARSEVLARLQPQLDLLSRMGEPSLDNPVFIRSVLYDESGDINPLLRRFVPDNTHSLMYITPIGNLPDSEILQAIRDSEVLLADANFTNITFTVISASKLVDAISVSMSSNFKILLGLSVLAMIVILVLLFRVRWRLLSLMMVGISTLWTFGLLGYLSVPLTMASMAALPILIGLGIDFSIQFHNRYQEELTRYGSVSEAIITSISRMFPVVGIALLATIIGFITLYISEVPMIRDFGLTLAVGIVISYTVGLFLLHSIVYIADRNVPLERLRAAALKASSRIERVLLRLGKLAISHTLWIFIIALPFAIGGGIVDHMLPVNTDYEEMMPQDNEVLKELREFREIMGFGGSIHFMVESDDVTTPEMLVWMKNFQEEMIETYPEIIVTSSIADIIISTAGGIPPTDQINTVLANTPDVYLEKVLSADRKTADMSFTIHYLPVEEIHELVQDVQEDVNLPAGATMSPVGSFVIGAWTMDAMVGSRMTMNLICLGAIFLILLMIYRRLDYTLFSVIPVGAVLAWSSLDMYLIGIPLNPLTAILGVIVIGICTEFMVLLMGRYNEEKSNGLPPEEAMVTAISKIGRAITTTAMTTLGGFGVLIVSNFVIIREFGIATVLGVLLCLVITITVMPGIIVWYDNLRLRLANKS
ncbi:MAG: RND family transporter [Dehalococcoidales bacterium]|nr:MAG: RND family transporter [Dehalococcoidales bacterium]